MTAVFSSAFQKGKTLFKTGSIHPPTPKSSLPSSSSFQQASEPTSLFPTVTPEIDGEDCDHDCESCEVKYPRGFKIEEDDFLYGHVNGWETHLLVATGKTDWVKDVTDEGGSVMEAVGRWKKESDGEPSNGKLMLSASNMPAPPDDCITEYYDSKDKPTTVLLLPAFTVVEGVTPARVPELIEHVIATAPTNTTPLKTSTSSSSSSSSSNSNNPAVTTNQPHSADQTTTTTTISSNGTIPKPTPSPPSIPPSSISPSLTPTPSTSLTQFKTHPSPHRYLILLCSQKTRDARCGQSAPLLRRELERHLRPLGLYRDMHDERPGGVGIYFISHVGGHKYSANVLVYRRTGFGKEEEGEGEEGAGQCIWLARVRPEDCEGIVKFTVLQGKVVKPGRQLRGGFDRGRGLVSW